MPSRDDLRRDYAAIHPRRRPRRDRSPGRRPRSEGLTAPRRFRDARRARGPPGPCGRRAPRIPRGPQRDDPEAPARAVRRAGGAGDTAGRVAARPPHREPPRPTRRARDRPPRRHLRPRLDVRARARRSGGDRAPRRADRGAARRAGDAGLAPGRADLPRAPPVGQPCERPALRDGALAQSLRGVRRVEPGLFDLGDAALRVGARRPPIPRAFRCAVVRPQQTHEPQDDGRVGEQDEVELILCQEAENDDGGEQSEGEGELATLVPGPPKVPLRIQPDRELDRDDDGDHGEGGSPPRFAKSLGENHAHEEQHAHDRGRP